MHRHSIVARLLAALCGGIALTAYTATLDSLPVGKAPTALSFSHFPDQLHAFVWRNWQLIPAATMARVVGAAPDDILRIGRAMGLAGPPEITADQMRRSYVTVIRRNWHLLPYDQLLDLLDWTPEQMAFTLREDDFLFVKLGNLKPACERLKYASPDARAQQRESEIARILREEFPGVAVGTTSEPLFAFVEQLSQMPRTPTSSARNSSGKLPQFCHSFFALYGDPLLGESDAYPDGYLARLAAQGVNGVWLHAVLGKLAPYPWDAKPDGKQAERIANLHALVARARKHGIGVYLYMNEPRAIPVAFFAAHPELKGVTEGDFATLCTSTPEVQTAITSSVASLCGAVPDLAGIFTITASENLTNCWSHHQGKGCPRCSKRSPAEVIAEVDACIASGIRESGSKTQLIAWDWGWADAWADDAITRLPADTAFMSVSEWGIPLKRGGVDSSVGEYSMSVVGPGERARHRWDIAHKRGLKAFAKIQAGNTWELAAVPYIPVSANVARHAANLRSANIDGVMLGWSLGGYPSPNLDVVSEIMRGDGTTTQAALLAVARRRFGNHIAPSAAKAWQDFSTAFAQFPFHGGLVYNAPMQYGPSNLLWERPTGYAATMVGFPYDDLDSWRSVYPADVFVAQFSSIADGFDTVTAALRQTVEANRSGLTPDQLHAVEFELDAADASAIHFRSTANQAAFVLARRHLEKAKTVADTTPLLTKIQRLLQEEIELARRLYWIQVRRSCIGFEASNHYFYVPMDLAEKVLNCRDLLDRWLPRNGGESTPL